jgi:hypothetical protein
MERKLAEMVRQHDGCQARYRGRNRARIRYLLTGLVVNVKRLGHLLLGASPHRDRSHYAMPSRHKDHPWPLGQATAGRQGHSHRSGGHVTYPSFRLPTTFSSRL